MERLLPLRLGGVLGLGRCAVPALIQRRNKYLESVTIRYSPCWRTRSRSSLLCNASSGGSSSSSSLGLFPAGKKQAKVVIPALFITVGADEVMESNAVLEDLAAAVYGGATAVVLYESATGGASELYEASLLVKELLRGRAALIIADRTDIAPAVEADGALLSPQGLPTVVAKRNMGDGLLLVGRTVASADAAVQAAKEGANYVILQGQTELPTVDEALAAKQQQLSSGSIPVVVSLAKATSPSSVRELLSAGIDGVSLPIGVLPALATVVTQKSCVDAAEAAAAVLQFLEGGAAHAAPAMPRDAASAAALQQQPSPREAGGPAAAAATKSPSTQQQQQGQQQWQRGLEDAEPPQQATRSAAAAAAAGARPLQLSQLLSTSREDMVSQEKEFLEEVLSFLQQHCTELQEVSLLEDALKQLDELFLLVVVGEFNSGKSAVINALLGQRYLAEGILPTTNEINILKWADPQKGGVRTEQGADGLYTRFLSAELLRELNVVDTPGTNVILERQQRLTEEYVPRADLVLFVLSADRPFTESEVRFLKYVRRWGKKVVFVVNKVDILTSNGEVSEVVEFVRQNAVRLLGVESPKVLPVSSRTAMEAKITAGGGGGSSPNGSPSGEGGSGTLDPQALSRLAADPRWHLSRFEDLERFIFNFLVGGGEGGGGGRGGVTESVRLKLQTPLAITDALLEAAGVQLQQELEVARQEDASVGLVRQQLRQFREGMVRDAGQQRAEVRRLVVGTTSRASAIVDETLQLSNLEVLTAYLFGKGDGGRAMPVAKRFEAELGEEAAEEIREVVGEHSRWLAANCERQLGNYRAFAEARAAALGQTLDELVAGEHLPGLERDVEARRKWRQMRQLATEPEEAAGVKAGEGGGPGLEVPPAGQPALAAVSALTSRSTEAFLEEEVREAVLSTAGTAAGAGAFGVLLTTILPTTLEDLLALALSGMVGYVSVLNLPLRRAEAKKKLEELADGYAQEVMSRMEAELAHALDKCEAEVLAFIEPLEQLMAEQVEAAAAAEAGREDLAERLGVLQRRVANLE